MLSLHWYVRERERERERERRKTQKKCNQMKKKINKKTIVYVILMSDRNA